MISPPSHAGGGNTGTTAEGGGGPRPASPHRAARNAARRVRRNARTPTR